MTLVGRWAGWYASLDEPAPYGDESTYRLGAEFLADCDTVEDWGCGKGWFRQFIDPGRYRGIDGSGSPFCDEIVDLELYRSNVDGVFLRHVLEHNPNWSAVLANALLSARRKLMIVLFTPLTSETQTIAVTAELNCPDIAFRLEDITEPMRISGFEVTVETFATNTQYGTETVIRASR